MANSYNTPARSHNGQLSKAGHLNKAGQLSKAIQEADVRTLNGYADHKQLEGYKDCYLAKSIHGTEIRLTARQTLTMGENDGPRNRWKYQGDVQHIAKEEYVANIPLPHLMYGCELEAKGISRSTQGANR